MKNDFFKLSDKKHKEALKIMDKFAEQQSGLINKIAKRLFNK